METISLNQKQVSTWKNSVKKMISSSSKFGRDKNGKEFMSLYTIFNDKEINPIIVMDQEVSPYGELFYPTKAVFTPCDISEDIKIFDTFTNKDYNISTPYNFDIVEFNRIVTTITSITFVKNGKTYDMKLEFKDKGEEFYNAMKCELMSYADRLTLISTNIESVVMNNTETRVIDSRQVLEDIHIQLLEKTQHTIEVGDSGLFLRLVFSVFPIKMDKLEYKRILNIKDEEVISTVYSKQYISNIIIHNFYRYIDVWNWNLKGKTNV